MANTKKTLLNIGDPSIWIILVPGIRFCNSSPSRTDRNKTIYPLRSLYTHYLDDSSELCWLRSFSGPWLPLGALRERGDSVGALRGRWGAVGSPERCEAVARKATTFEPTRAWQEKLQQLRQRCAALLTCDPTPPPPQ